MHRAHAHVTNGQPLQAIDAAFFAQDSVQVGQDLGRVLAPAIAAVNDRDARPLGGFLRRALLEMAHDDHITVELEHLDCILDGFLVEVSGTGHLGIREAGDMASQAVHGGFMSQTRARRRLIESRYQGLVFEHIHILACPGDGLPSPRQHRKTWKNSFRLEFLKGKNITTSKTTHTNLHLVMKDLDEQITLYYYNVSLWRLEVIKHIRFLACRLPMYLFTFYFPAVSLNIFGSRA